METKHEQALWALLEGAKSPIGAAEAAEALDIDRKDAEEGLTALLQRGRILRTKGGKYALPALLGGASGRLMGLRRGDAFFIPDDGTEDLFIRGADRHSAMHGDAVVVRKVRANAGMGRRGTGRVVTITARAHETVVGTVMRQNGGGVLKPDDQRLMDIVIDAAALNGAQSHQMAVVRITDYGSESTPPRGTVTRVLGEEGTISAGIAAILHEHDLTQAFDPKTLRAARAVPQSVAAEEIAGREDFRHLSAVTIDGADAKDFDDAISLVKTAKGYTLYVHIADVTHYVKPNTPLDAEAYARATSVYFPDRVLPMLPEALSNGICSLKEGEDRLCLSCVAEIDARGAVQQYRFCQSVIRVEKRVLYEHANALFDDEDQPLMEQYRGVWPMLKQMQRLAGQLTQARAARGALDFDLSEPTFTLDGHGQPADVRPSQRGVSNIMIEEFMLIANECAAKYAKKNNLPALYRIHDEPDASRVETFGLLLKALGQPGLNRKERLSPRALQSILRRVANQPYEMVVSRVMLRTMQKAKYSESAIGHFGLALRDYCHFTSPIRRYPDIVVHRAIIASLEGGLAEKAAERLHTQLPAIAQHTSERERAAMEAERAVDNLYCAAYMHDKVGERYQGVISGVAEFGIFVEIMGVIEGMIPINALGEDVFTYDEVLYRITGRYTGARYALGDRIEIVVEGADITRRRIDFTPYKPKSAVKKKPSVNRGKKRKSS